MPLSRSASSRVATPFSVATRWPLASRAVAISNERAPSLVASEPYCITASGSSVNVHSFTAPRTPWAAPIRAMQMWAAIAARRQRLFLGGGSGSGGGRGGGFGVGLALLARHGLFRIVARGALHHAGGIEEARHAVRRLRALGEPGLGLVHVDLQPCLVVLRQQRIEMPEPFDEAAVARKARIGNDDMIDRTLLGACAGEADDDWHGVLLVSGCELD